MTPTQTTASLLAAALLAAAPAGAQDSVAKTGCLPGDGVIAYSTAEQANSYVVDMVGVTSSWNNKFALAPLVKSSKVSPNFSGSLLSAQTMSRTQLINVPTPSSSYMYWNQAGFGVNDNLAINDPGTPIDTTGLLTNQFAVAFAEFSSTGQSVDYNGVMTALVNVAPADPTRLYVRRVVGAINGCDDGANLSQFGLGTIDASGNLMIRADGFGISGGGTGCPTLAGLTGDNVFKVSTAARNAGALNVVSNDWIAGGQFDKPATAWLVRNSGTAHNTPGLVPSTPPLMMTTTSSLFVRGPAFGSITSDGTHLAAGVTDNRGNISYTRDNLAALGSTNGLAAMLGLDSNFDATILNVFGLNAAGNVTGKTALTLPAVVTDNATGYANIPGVNEFGHYQSQAAFRGGNGQVAMGLDQAGRLLVAAEVVQPDDSLGNAWGWNYIAVARTVDGTPGTTSWTMAAYCDASIPPSGGKPVLDGSGAVIGNLVEFSYVTGGGGPSVSAPMLDSVGNVWFIGVIMYPNFDVRTALLRAVYDPVAFSYKLERVLQVGDTFRGRNSDRDFLLTYFSIADSNSVSSSTAFSQNISEEAHMAGSPANLAPADPTTLGGLVLNAGVLYDMDDDGVFSNCSSDPLSPDVSYNALLYLGSRGKLDIDYKVRPTANRSGGVQHQ